MVARAGTKWRQADRLGEQIRLALSEEFASLSRFAQENAGEIQRVFGGSRDSIDLDVTP